MTEEEKEAKVAWWFRRKAVKIACYSAIVLVAFVAITAVFIPGAATSISAVSPILLAYIAGCKALLAWYMHCKGHKTSEDE